MNGLLLFSNDHPAMNIHKDNTGETIIIRLSLMDSRSLFGCIGGWTHVVNEHALSSPKVRTVKSLFDVGKPAPPIV